MITSIWIDQARLFAMVFIFRPYLLIDIAHTEREAALVPHPGPRFLGLENTDGGSLLLSNNQRRRRALLLRREEYPVVREVFASHVLAVVLLIARRGLAFQYGCRFFVAVLLRCLGYHLWTMR